MNISKDRIMELRASTPDNCDTAVLFRKQKQLKQIQNAMDLLSSKIFISFGMLLLISIVLAVGYALLDMASELLNPLGSRLAWLCGAIIGLYLVSHFVRLLLTNAPAEVDKFLSVYEPTCKKRMVLLQKRLQTPGADHEKIILKWYQAEKVRMSELLIFAMTEDESNSKPKKIALPQFVARKFYEVE